MTHTESLSTHPPDACLTIETPAYTGPERRSAMRLWQESVDRRLQNTDAQLRDFRANLDVNTAATQRIESNTAELVQLLNHAKGAFRVLDLLGRLARPLGAIVALGASALAMWTSIKAGGKS